MSHDTECTGSLHLQLTKEYTHVMHPAPLHYSMFTSYFAPRACSPWCVQEGCRPDEHNIHIGDSRNIPIRDVHIEGCRIVEHPIHVGDSRHIPIGDVDIEGCRICKHPLHVGDLRHIPIRDVPIEGTCMREHPLHVGNS